MKAVREFFRARPMAWGAWETAVMRLLFAVVILFSGIIWESAKLPAPGTELEKANGLAAVIPLGWLAEPQVLSAGKPLVAAGLICYVASLAPVFSLLPALVYMLGTGALRNSQGDISHHTQIVAMVLLAQWIVYLTGAVRQKKWGVAAAGAHSQAVFWSILTIGASYFASGIVKLKASDFQWIQNTPAFSVQIIKAVWSASYSSGEAVSGFKAEQAPLLIAHHPWLARMLFGTGLLLELAGWFMVLSRRHAFWIALGLIAMHLGISVLMEIEFWNHMLLLAIFAVNVPGLLARLRRSAVSSPPATGSGTGTATAAGGQPV